MNNRVSQVAPSSGDKTLLRVLRLPKGASETIRTIDGAYSGLVTHHIGGRSLYCVGDSCPPAMHKVTPVWKGYAGVEQWDRDSKHWLPAVLEITEAMELDFREKWSRGQMWEITRSVKIGNKNPTCSARFIERVDLTQLRKPFDIMPPLFVVYHTPQVVLGVDSWLPSRIHMEPAKGAPPPAERRKEAEDKPQTKEEWQKMRAEMVNGHKMPG